MNANNTNECYICFKEYTSSISICGNNLHKICVICGIKLLNQEKQQCPMCREVVISPNPNNLLTDEIIDIRKL
jgi:hypothetical protein